ncbi:hypothetical protein QTN25_009474 [Entamoeba marina]
MNVTPVRATQKNAVMLSGVPGHKERIEKGLDSVIKYRRTTSRFKQQKYQWKCEDLNEHNMPNKICKTSQAIVVSSSSNNKENVLMFLTKLNSTLWSDELKNSLIEKNNAPVVTYCLSIGLSLQHFIRYPPRPAPTVL